MRESEERRGEEEEEKEESNRCMLNNSSSVHVTLKERDERNGEHGEKDKFRKDLKRAVRSDGERETFGTVFRSSFNN